MDLILILVLLPPLAASVLSNTADRLLILFISVTTVVFWEFVFSQIRKISFGISGLTTAILVSILAPNEIMIWQLFVVLSLGVVLAEHIFGGRGYSFINPAILTLALLLYSFPQISIAPLPDTISYLALPGVFILILMGIVSWRIIVAFVLTVLLLQGAPATWIDMFTLLIGFIFALIFLICDPFSSPSTNIGRWIYGVFIGYFVVFSSSNSDVLVSLNSVVFATLLGSIFAPLFDRVVVIAHKKIRTRHHV